MRSGRYTTTNRRTTSAKAAALAMGVLKLVECSVAISGSTKFATTSPMTDVSDTFASNPDEQRPRRYV
jgi:hypothetical protein